jgi:hypothetical protein
MFLNCHTSPGAYQFTRPGYHIVKSLLLVEGALDIPKLAMYNYLVIYLQTGLIQPFTGKYAIVI